MTAEALPSLEVGEDTILPLRVDRNNTFQVRRRFLNINRLRLRRTYESLAPHQRCFLDLLPLLFHTNHPLMPGYVDGDCPRGLSDYTPNKQTLAQARRTAGLRPDRADPGAAAVPDHRHVDRRGILGLSRSR